MTKFSSKATRAISRLKQIQKGAASMMRERKSVLERIEKSVTNLKSHVSDTPSESGFNAERERLLELTAEAKALTGRLKKGIGLVNNVIHKSKIIFEEERISIMGSKPPKKLIEELDWLDEAFKELEEAFLFAEAKVGKMEHLIEKAERLEYEKDTAEINNPQFERVYTLLKNEREVEIEFGKKMDKKTSRIKQILATAKEFGLELQATAAAGAVVPAEGALNETTVGFGDDLNWVGVVVIVAIGVWVTFVVGLHVIDRFDL